MDKSKSWEFAKEWEQCWNSRDINRIMAHYTVDVQVESPLASQRYPESNGVITGKESVRAYWTLGLQLNPDLEFQIKEVYTGVDSLSICYLSKSSGKEVIETMTLDKENHVCKVIACYK